MEEYRNTPKRPVNPRRRKRSKLKIFTEAYLPVIIAALILVLIIVFIVSAIKPNHNKKDPTEPTTVTDPTTQTNPQASRTS